MSKKLPEIERTPGGGLPRMTPAQRKRANALIRKTCCNYNGGNCLLLDDGEECVCPQTISYSVCCKWFRWAVLPQDKALEAGIFRSAPSAGRLSFPAPTGPNTAQSAPQGYLGGRRTPATENAAGTRTNKGQQKPINQGL